MIGTMTSLSMLIGRLEVLVDLFSVLWYSLNGLKRRGVNFCVAELCPYYSFLIESSIIICL